MTPIAVQATLRGVPMAALLGRTAAELVALGYDVASDVHPAAVFQRAGSFIIDLGEFPAATGYMWRQPPAPDSCYIVSLAWRTASRRWRFPAVVTIVIGRDAIGPTCWVKCGACGIGVRAKTDARVPDRVGAWWAHAMRAGGCEHWTNATEAAVARSINEGWA